MMSRSVPEAESLLLHVAAEQEATRRVREELTKVAPTPEELQQVSVSRLVNPGRAYYELVHPLAEDLAAHQKRLAGSGAHDLLERSLAAGVELTEMWLHGEESLGEPSLDRITARVDACERTPDGHLLPIELKNVGTERDRPADEHLEQLGMYCALLGFGQGRVLAVLRDDVTGSSRLLVPWKVTFPDLGKVRQVMAERRDLLTDAFERRDPSRLPACPWWSVGCRYREAGVCTCGDRAPLESSIARAAKVERDPEYLALVQDRAATREAARAAAPSEQELSLYGLLTPRKQFFRARSRSGDAEEGPAAGGATAPAPAATAEHRAQADRVIARVNSRGVERQIFSAVLRSNGPRAGFAQAAAGGRSWRVPVLEGRPFLVRVRHVGRPLDASSRDLAGNWGVPDDLRQLALRASLLGVDGGWIYVWNWKLPESEQKLQVFSVRFDPEGLRRGREYAEGLPARLATAIASGDPRALPLCPRWMCPKCPYLEACRPDQG